MKFLFFALDLYRYIVYTLKASRFQISLTLACLIAELCKYYIKYLYTYHKLRHVYELKFYNYLSYLFVINAENHNILVFEV